MTDIALVTDMTEQALERLIDTYQGLPRLTGLITAITNRLQELEDINWDVINKRMLDYEALDGTPSHAVAQQLDTIGKVVGRGRNGQTDAVYLIYIRAQIFLNKSRALRGDIVTLLQLVETATFTYREFYPCTVQVAFVDAPATDPNVLLDIAQKCVTGGVQLFLSAPPPGVTRASTFTVRDVSASNNAVLGVGHFGSTLFGGHLASAYA
jgi:hypothetical protein